VAARQAPEARGIHKRIRAGKAVLAGMADDLLAATTANIAESGVGSADGVRQGPAKLAAFSPGKARAVGGLQEFLEANVYRHERNRRATESGQAILRELFDAYVREPSRLPPRYQQRIEKDGLHRVVCDYIAGMTDQYCRKMHQGLFA